MAISATSVTPPIADNSTNVATTAFVKAQGYAPIASPALTGTPTAPTPATADNSTKIATTAFVKAQGYLTPATADANYVDKFGDTMSGPLVLPASTAGTSGFNIPHGVAPTSPVNGDIWTATAGLYARINSVTVGPYAVAGEPIIAAGTTAQYWRGDKSWQKAGTVIGRDVTVSTSAPSGGVDGDIWFKV